MDEPVREKLRKLLDAPPAPPLDATRKFLQSFCDDEGSLDDIRMSIRRMAAINTRSLRAGLAGIEGLLERTPTDEGVLSRLVADDAGLVLDDGSDVAAARWLRTIATILREELASEPTAK